MWNNVGPNLCEFALDLLPNSFHFMRDKCNLGTYFFNLEYIDRDIAYSIQEKEN